MEIKKCENCGSEHIHAITKEIGYSCSKCGRNTVRQNEMHQTNADRIRSMSDEELAEFIINNCDNPISQKNDDMCDYCEKYEDEKTAECDSDGCKKAIVKWLQSEVEE